MIESVLSKYPKSGFKIDVVAIARNVDKALVQNEMALKPFAPIYEKGLTHRVEHLCKRFCASNSTTQAIIGILNGLSEC